jgi:AraC-like DNA-binding protein
LSTSSKQCTVCFKVINRESGSETYSSRCNSCYKKQYYSERKAAIDSRNKKNYHEKYKAVRANRSCLFCKSVFSPKSALARCCSKKCSSSAWRINNKDKIAADQKYRYQTDVQRRIATNIRSRLNKALKGAYKPASIIDSLGCSPGELKRYLESQFAKNMSWKNYGQWHIDHIEPLARFNLADPVEFNRACHYTNLQPLWAKDNLSKGGSCYLENVRPMH